MKTNLLFSQASALSKRLAMLLTLFLTVGIGQVWGATDIILWNGSNPSYAASTTEKTSTDGAIKWKNSVANSYSNPTRIYSGNTLTISVANTTTTKITKIVAVCSSNDYASAFGGTSVTVTGGGSATRSVNSTTTTITISGTATVVAIKMSAQSRVSKLTVTYETASSDPCTVTLVPGSGSVTNTELEEPNAGAGVTLPTPTLDGCDEWSFAGWKTTSAVTTETTTEPTLIPAGEYSPTSDITLYAVYQRTEDGGGGSTTGSKTLVSNSNSSYYESGYITGVSGTNSASWTADGFTMVQNKNSSSNAVALNYAEIRVYASHSIVFTPSTGSTITSIVATATTDAYANALGGSSITNCTKSVSSSIVTITPTDGTKAITITNTAQSRLKTIVVNYTTSGGGSTTYYHSTPDCATETAVYLIPKNSDFWMAYLRRIFGLSSAASVTLP